jgi:hypothetical protein
VAGLGDALWRIITHLGAAYSGAVILPLAPSSAAPRSGQDRSSAALTESAQSRRKTRRALRSDRHGYAAIVVESEAFLAGRYYEFEPKKECQRVPGWLWINPLAHAERSELERLAHTSSGRPHSLALLSYLADEVLLCVGDDDNALKKLQRDTLVPLELAALTDARCQEPIELTKTILNKIKQPVRHRPGSPS